jgi:hypothetical protein
MTRLSNPIPAAGGGFQIATRRDVAEEIPHGETYAFSISD